MSPELQWDPKEELEIRVEAEAGADAIWVVDREGDLYNIDGHDIGLDPALVRELADWAQEYHDSFNWNDPANSGPAPEGFYERGWNFALRVRHAVSSAWTVLGADPKTYKRVEVPR